MTGVLQSAKTRETTDPNSTLPMLEWPCEPITSTSKLYDIAVPAQPSPPQPSHCRSCAYTSARFSSSRWLMP